MNAYQTFQIGAVLSAISVPVLAAVGAVDELSTNRLIVSSVGFAGFMFLIASLFSYADLLELHRVPDMKVSEALEHLFSAQGALFTGIITLLIFQTAQTRALF